MKLIFAVIDVSLTVGLTRCYKTEGFLYIYIIRNHIFLLRTPQFFLWTPHLIRPILWVGLYIVAYRRVKWWTLSGEWWYSKWWSGVCEMKWRWRRPLADPGLNVRGPHPFPSLSPPFLSLSSFPLEVGPPSIAARSLGERLSSPSGSRRSHGWQTYFGAFYA